MKATAYSKRKMKVVPLHSRFFRVSVDMDGETIAWFVISKETCASTPVYNDLDAYYRLKRAWRESKIGFDTVCRFMDFDNLFSISGVKL